MKVILYSIYDIKVKVFHAPICAMNGDQARRHFASVSANPGNPYYDHPEDYRLMAVGLFSDESGLVEGIGTPDHVCSGDDLATMADDLKRRRDPRNE